VGNFSHDEANNRGDAEGNVVSNLNVTDAFLNGRIGGRFYAVAYGREGLRIYTNYQECKKNTDGFKGARHKSFTVLEEAHEWMERVHRGEE
jgi:viroplasmin and RNaseH domain-containing protein